jgi:hypothetical protein
VEEFRQKDSSRLGGKVFLLGGGFEVERSDSLWHNTVTSLVEFVVVNRLYTRFRDGTRGVFVFIAFFSYLSRSASLFRRRRHLRSNSASGEQFAFLMFPRQQRFL